MPLTRTLVAAGALALSGGLAACGASDGSTPGDASPADFCRTFSGLRATTAPHDLAAALSKVGTPQDIDASARRGFEVLIDHLRALPANSQAHALRGMARRLVGSEETDVVAFLNYVTRECHTDLPS